MTRNGNGKGRRGPRYIFQVDSASDAAVIRVLDTLTNTVFREIPVEEFVRYARENRDVKKFLLGHLPQA